MKFGCSLGIFLNSAHLTCRSTDNSKCLRGTLRLRDNESRLYFNIRLLPTKTRYLNCTSGKFVEYEGSNEQFSYPSKMSVRVQVQDNQNKSRDAPP